MKNLSLLNANFLLSNVNGKIYSTSNRCGHQNEPLDKGTLGGNVVTCQIVYVGKAHRARAGIAEPVLVDTHDVAVDVAAREGEVLPYS